MKQIQYNEVKENACHPLVCAVCGKCRAHSAQVESSTGETDKPKSLYGAEALIYDFYLPSPVSRA